MGLEPGLRAALEHTVTEADTAAALGSGDLAVLATPRLVALAEAATCAAVAGHLPAGSTTVGTRVAVEHLRATPVGAAVAVRAELVHVDGRLLRFDVVAEDDAGALVGHAEVTRVVVDRDRFLAGPAARRSRGYAAAAAASVSHRDRRDGAGERAQSSRP